MGPRTSYVPGTFSHVHLGPTDLTPARTFYGELFGWTTEAIDTGAPYEFFRLDGDIVAGLAGLSDDSPTDAMRPSWMSYVTVEDADATVTRAQGFGAAAIEEPFDVLGAGRMALVTDPQGAAVVLWEPHGRIGAERVNDLGCLTMNELATSDLDGARAFYESLFGWTTEAIDTGPDGPPIFSVMNRGMLNATISLAPSGTSPHWRPYFTVASVAAARDRVGELGGSVAMPPIPIPGGSIALVLDPQGALFGLFEGRTDP